MILSALSLSSHANFTFLQNKNGFSASNKRYILLKEHASFSSFSSSQTPSYFSVLGL